MADAYKQLLDATIGHLQHLKARGVRYVAVSPAILAALTADAARSPRGVAPAPGRVSAPPAAIPLRTASARGGTPPSQVFPTRAAENTIRGNGPPVAQPAAPAPAQSAGSKAAAFAELRQRALACKRCPNLAASRKNVVFGVGNIEARLMFVGEAPGADEDAQAEPFVGKAGQLLTRIIQTTGLARETVYIANILKCRPDTPGQTAGNRKPSPEEMQTCIPYLHEQIDLIRPEVIVALGATAVEGLLGKTLGITKLRGHWQVYRGIPLMPTYHPAYLLRNQAMSEKRKVWEDMLLVMEKLALPITLKQRNYFLKTA